MSELYFKQEVIDKSYEIPVVVDFWAPWCGPCQYLGPVIEQLATEANGKWQLVKVNTDENQDIAIQYGIQGIPAVKMFINGKVADEFTGALPRPQIEQWLEKNIPDERKKQLAGIAKALENGTEGALGELQDFVEANPDLLDGRVLLAGHLVFDDPEKAAALVEDVQVGKEHFQKAENIRDLAAFSKLEVSSDGPLAAKIREAQAALRTKEMTPAVEKLIDVIMVDKSAGEELPRKAVIAIFNLLGPENPITRQFRRRFDMALY